MKLGRAARIGGFFIFIILLIWAVIRLWPILLPLFLALLFAYILQPAVRALEGLEVRSGAAIGIVYAYFFILIASLFSLCLPILNAQFGNLFRLLPELLQQTRLSLSRLLTRLDSPLLLDVMERMTATANQLLADKLQAFVDDSGRLLALILRSALYTALTPFLAYYILRDKGLARRQIAAWLPVSERRELARLAGDVDHLLRQYVVGYLLVSLIVAALSAAFYWCVGLRDPLALGLIMGVADLIPYFGPFLGAIPGVVVALSQDTGLAVLVAVGLVVVQQLESIVITPKIMGDKVGLHPLITIVAVLAGGWLFGVLGTILAVPVTAAGLLMLRYLWSRMVGAKIT